MPSVNIPETLSFTQQEIADMAKRPSLNDGWYRFIVVEATKKVAEKGSFMLTTVNAALRDPEDENTKVRPHVFDNIILPKVNPQVPGHQKPNTAGLVAQTFRAFYPDEIPEMPRKVDGVLAYKGEEITKEEEEEKRQEVSALIGQKMTEAWEAPHILVGQAFYAELFTNGDYKNLRNKCHELPADAVLQDPENFFPAPAEQAAKQPAKKKGKK